MKARNAQSRGEAPNSRGGAAGQRATPSTAKGKGEKREKSHQRDATTPSGSRGPGRAEAAAARARRDLAQTRQGKYVEGFSQGAKAARSSSAISVQPPNQFEGERNRQLLLSTHPLLGEDPSSWNNIPQCLASAVAKMISCLVEDDEHLYDFQMATNGRIHGLQEQISEMKRAHAVFEAEIARTIDQKVEREEYARKDDVQNLKVLLAAAEQDIAAMREPLEATSASLTVNEEEIAKLSSWSTEYTEQVKAEFADALAITGKQLVDMHAAIKKEFEPRVTLQTGGGKRDLGPFLLEQLEELEPRIVKRVAALGKRLEACSIVSDGQQKAISSLQGASEALEKRL